MTPNAILDELRLEGISIVHSLFDPIAVERALLIATKANLVQDKAGAKRMLERADMIEELTFFFRSPVLSTVFTALLGATAVSRRNRIQVRTDHWVRTSPIQLFHLDSVAERYKVFLYLSDVSGTDGPLEYFRGTHVGGWREPYLDEIREILDQNSKGDCEALEYSGSIRTLEVLSQVMANFDLCRVIGAAGTCVLFDTRGFHRAAPFERGCRQILSMDWMRAPEYV
jgi:hypothetical protein